MTDTWTRRNSSIWCIPSWRLEVTATSRYSAANPGPDPKPSQRLHHGILEATDEKAVPVWFGVPARVRVQDAAVMAKARAAAAHCGWTAKDRISKADFLQASHTLGNQRMPANPELAKA